MGSFMLADADKDQVSIAALNRTSYNEGEGVTVTVGLPYGFTAGATITVGYELIVTTTDEAGKASAADIDGPTSGFVTINEGDRTAIITINLEDNDGAELMEQLGIRLTSASGTSGITFDNTTTQLTILDTDPTKYMLEGSATVVEGVAYTVRLRRVGGLITPDATVSYTVSDAATGNDVDAADFGGTFPTGSFTFSGDDALSDEISIATGDDQTLENDETFQISAGGATKDVTINDNDAVKIGFDPVMYTVDEGAGTVRLTIKVLDGSLGRDITLNYRTDDGTATAGEDYTSKDSMLTLSADATEETIEVDITDDDLLENAEMFTVVLSGAPARVTLTPDTAEVTITDTNAPDAVEIGFEPVMYTVDEGDGTVRLTVKVLDGSLGRDDNFEL